MKIELGKENSEAEDLLPPNKPDGSKIGVNYTDAYLKNISGELEDGGIIAVKRRGLKLTMTMGENKGIGLMRRLDKGPEPKDILRAALEEAAQDAGAIFSVEDGVMFLELS